MAVHWMAKLITAVIFTTVKGKDKQSIDILIIGVVILVLITSLGIYGFLTSFQDTFNMFSRSEKQRYSYNKEKFYMMMLQCDEELERISNNIGALSNAKSQQSKYGTHRLWGC